MITTKYAEHWLKSIPLLWDIEEVVNSLHRKFYSINVKRILDCACGTGTFAIELAKRGYEIDCSDGCESMVAVTESEAKKNRIPLKPKVVRWGDISKHFSGDYDVVMVRGNSIPYVISWDNQDDTFYLDIEKADEELIKSFKAVHEQLRPGGIFYFDMRGMYEKEGKEVVGQGTIDRKVATLTFDVSYHRGYLRKVISELRIGNKVETRFYNSYHLPFLKLDDLLQDAGFKLENIRHCVAINGEYIYTPFFVTKAITSDSINYYNTRKSHLA